MEQKEKFYLDVLELEPGSRLFYPLADIYLKQNRLREAREVLLNGLKHHPDHFDARLLLAAIHFELGEKEESLELVRDIFSRIQSRFFFWDLLARDYQDAGREEMGLALKIISAQSRNEPVSLAGIMRVGLESFLNSGPDDPAGTSSSESRPENTVSRAPETGDTPETDEDDQEIETPESEARSGEEEGADRYPMLDEDAEEVEDLDFDDPARTRSMADLLFNQEEYEQALRIYRHLWRGTKPGAERRELEDIIVTLENKLSPEKDREEDMGGEAELPENGEDLAGEEAGSGNVPAKEAAVEQKRDEVVDTLTRLAERLEQRAGA
ncbi:MAG: tetratricopeptide repeat protein [Desulfovibrionales bacterium]